MPLKRFRESIIVSIRLLRCEVVLLSAKERLLYIRGRRNVTIINQKRRVLSILFSFFIILVL